MSGDQRLRLFVHVEEPSMKEALDNLLLSLLPLYRVDIRIIDHGSKKALLANVPDRLRGYAKWADPALRVIVLVDRDEDDCRALKANLEGAALVAGLTTKTAPGRLGEFQVVNRIVIEELEAWFLGDIEALADSYPGVPPTLARKAAFRDPDAIRGGTWEALSRVLKAAGHYGGSDRLPKIEVARRVSSKMVPSRNRSHSFKVFVAGLGALVAA